MIQNRILITIVLLLTILSGEKHAKCQQNDMEELLPRNNQPIYDFYRSNYQANNNQQQPFHMNGMPFIVKDVNYGNDSGLKPMRNTEEASCVDGKKSLKSSAAEDPPGTCAAKPPSGPASGSPSSSSSAPSSGSPSPGSSSNSRGSGSSGGVPMASQASQNNQKLHELQKLIQQLYVAQAQVQLEATEIQRSQSIAAAAQQSLEEAANNVRVITAALHAAQETVAACALRAQTAQLQLAAHDQLLFTARQRVDALSSQMVGLQAEEGIGENKIVVDIPALLAKLKEPLPEPQKPTPVPSIIGSNSGGSNSGSDSGFSNSNNNDFSNERSADNGKYFNQAKTYRPDRLIERKESIYDGGLVEPDGIDSLEEDGEKNLGEELQKSNADSLVGINSNTLTEDDLKTLVDFIVSTEHRQSPQQRDGTLNVADDVSESNRRTEDRKYFDDFLNGIRNSEMAAPPQFTRNDAVRITKRDPKLNDRLLSLHQSLFRSKKQISSADGQEDQLGLDFEENADSDMTNEMQMGANDNSFY